MPHCRDRGQALALSYRVRQAREAEVRSRYEKLCGELGIRVSDRGYRTFLAEYRSEWRAYRTRGQDYETTNGLRARALAAAGRPRCARTVRRTRQRLERAGLIAYEHVHRSGRYAVAGKLDTLRVRVLHSSFVPLPSAAEARADKSSLASSATSSLSAPASPAEPDPPPYGGGVSRSAETNSVTEEASAEASPELLARLEAMNEQIVMAFQ